MLLSDEAFPFIHKAAPFMPDEGVRGKRQETTAAPGYCNSPNILQKGMDTMKPSVQMTI